MAKDKWIAKAVPEKNKGKFTAKAKAAGESVQDYAKEKIHSKNPTLRGEAQFAMRAKKGFKEGGKVKKDIDLKIHQELPPKETHKGFKTGGHVMMNAGGSSHGHKCMKKGGMC